MIISRRTGQIMAREHRGHEYLTEKAGMGIKELAKLVVDSYLGVPAVRARWMRRTTLDALRKDLDSIAAAFLEQSLRGRVQVARKPDAKDPAGAPLRRLAVQRSSAKPAALAKRLELGNAE